jgi:hypothetical protein
MGKDHNDAPGPYPSHASQAQLYTAAAIQTAAGNRPSTTVTALFNDFVSWLGDRGSKQRDGEQRTGSVHRAPVDKEAQAAAAAEIRQDAEDERGHAEALKGLDHKSLSQDIVKHAQYHYNPGRDVVFRGEFIPVRLSSCHMLPLISRVLLSLCRCLCCSHHMRC